LHSKGNVVTTGPSTRLQCELELELEYHQITYTKQDEWNKAWMSDVDFKRTSIAIPNC